MKHSFFDHQEAVATELCSQGRIGEIITPEVWEPAAGSDNDHLLYSIK